VAPCRKHASWEAPRPRQKATLSACSGRVRIRRSSPPRRNSSQSGGPEDVKQFLEGHHAMDKNRMTKKRVAKNGNGASLGFEAELFKAADKLRGNMEPSDYKHVVLGLIFLKYISDAFEARHQALL